METLEWQAGPGKTLAHSTSVDTALSPCREFTKSTSLSFEAGKEGRKRKVILGDGNCLFTAIAHIIYGTEDNHATVCVCVCVCVSNPPNISMQQQAFPSSSTT